MYIFIKDRVSPTGRDGAVPHTSRKFAYSYHHLEKVGNPPLPAAKFGIPPPPVKGRISPLPPPLTVI